MTMYLLASIAGPVASGLLNKSKPKESPIQKQQRKSVDEILAGTKGSGPYANLFASDIDAFQKSYVDPTIDMFSNQISPQIQQSYIASGQQRGTGMEDALTRAGIDMQKLLSQQYGQFQESAMDRQMRALGLAQGAGPGVAPGDTSSERMGQAASGYLASPGYSDLLERIFGQSSSGLSVDNNQSGNRRGYT
ncbi:MAG TPA: hypothetical protein VJ327_01915 [Patescibacteria group bacterium]|nr:hypothetical protein [Patescibacteria group bacterium]